MSPSAIERGDLELFVEIVASGSLTKAAKALRIHHATAFRRLTELERKAGLPLFDRLPRGYVPTAAARKLFPAARQIRSELLRRTTRVRAFLDFFYEAIVKERSRLAGHSHQRRAATSHLQGTRRE